MKHKLDTDNWNRKEHFNFFKNFDEPYYGVTIKLDCTKAYQRSKELGVTFYSYYLHKTLVAVNEIENFKCRIEDSEVFVYDSIDASATILRDDHTFGFSHMRYSADLKTFDQSVKQEIERIKNTTGLFTIGALPNIVHFSALPWVNFSSISQASNFKSGDSCPKFSIGKLIDEDGKKQMSYAVHVHHALVDGYHLGLFFEKLQLLMDE